MNTGVERDPATVADLALLAPGRDAETVRRDLLQVLKARFARNVVYTSVGVDTLVGCNPGVSTADSPSDQIKAYAREARGDGGIGAGTTALPPHVLQLAGAAYQHMLLDQQHQTIALAGVAYSGKSTSMALISRMLVQLSRKGSKKTRVESGLGKLDALWQAFGTAHNAAGTATTRHSVLLEHGFDEAGVLTAFRIESILLDRQRVIVVPPGGRNYSVFYMLLAGATAEEKQAFHLEGLHVGTHPYLSRGNAKAALTPEDQLSFGALRQTLKALGVGRRQQAQLWQLLAAILHLGLLEFGMHKNAHPNDPCQVKNTDVLATAAACLGISAEALETALTYRTKVVKKELCTVLLTVQEAALQRDELAYTLYAQLVAWLVQHLNQRYYREALVRTSITVVDLQGLSAGGAASEPGQLPAGSSCFQFLANYAAERLGDFVHQSRFERLAQQYVAAGLATPPEVASSNNLFTGPVRVAHEVFAAAEALKTRPEKDVHRAFVEQVLAAVPRDISALVRADTSAATAELAVRHSGDVAVLRYAMADFVPIATSAVVPSDVAALFRGPGASRNAFLRSMFALEKAGQGSPTLVASLRANLDAVFERLLPNPLWHVAHVCPTAPGATSSVVGAFAAEHVAPQLRHLELDSLVARYQASPFHVVLPAAHFVHVFGSVLSQQNGAAPQNAAASVRHFAELAQLTPRDLVIGGGEGELVFASEPIWCSLRRSLRGLNAGTGDRDDDAASACGSEVTSIAGGSAAGADDSDTESHFESLYGGSDAASMYQRRNSDATLAANGANAAELGMGKAAKKAGDADAEASGKKKMTVTRKRWVCCTWMLTWWVPWFFLSLCGGMKRGDVRMAWREKLALCILIALACAAMLFIIVGLTWVVCPPQHTMSISEVGAYDTLSKPYVALYGRFFQVSDIITSHIQRLYVSQYGPFTDPAEGVLGTDVSSMFPRDFATVCTLSPAPPPGWTAIAPTIGRYRYVHNMTGRDYVPSLYPLAKGWVAYSWNDIFAMATTQKVAKFVTVIYDNVYDFTQYPAIAGQPNGGFLGNNMITLIQANAGKDATAAFAALRSSMGAQGDALLQCINNVFYIGKVDHRNDFACVFTNVIMMIATTIIVAVIGVKFIASLRIAPSRDPEDHDKFVICQIPCYTEGPESLGRTLETLAMMRYDDKRKLLFVIADGMIIGSGNDRPTPRIVLDILGTDPSLDPEPLSFLSIGDGNRQLNMGKVYSGLYDIQGHTVPYLVVVKVGSPTERSRPGNRGKRDSQLILMRFLSKVHFNQEMSPLELEVYHHMKNVIGVQPSFYEYILMVDADTEVLPDALNRMISHMIHDSKVMGLCGETLLLNEKDSFITMIQVYEYFISHHMAKAFESFFGSVTCLPGCFCMYRIRSPVKNVPLLIAPGVIADYSENDVRTLHMKNLLSLGEDRYLTTLMLKHFPDQKTMFTADSQCRTNAPDRWGVLLSQRRRWINSTVHNLAELLFLSNMCGCCCFSMRFIVFMDLLGTVVAPATLIYIGYLVYMIVWGDYQFPLISIIMIAAIYGFQVIVFVLKRQWQHIGWMIIYLLATPVYSFYLPIYSFWHFDDFSWGNTRLVADAKGSAKYVADSEPFDPSSIPQRKWVDYEQEIWDTQSVGGASQHSASRRPASTVQGTRNSMLQGPFDDGASVYGASVYNGGQPPASAGPRSSVYAAPPPAALGMIPMQQPAFAYGAPNASLRRPASVQPDAASAYGGSDGSARRPMSVRSSVSRAPADPSGPSNDELRQQITVILASANLMTITKKQVRDMLAAHFGADMTSRKEFISATIDGILRGRKP